MIERIKLFIGFDDFYNKKELLKRQFTLMTLEEKEIFKLYVYSTFGDNKYEADRLVKDAMWKYIVNEDDDEIEEQYDLYRRKCERLY